MCKIQFDHHTMYRWWVPVNFARVGGDFSNASNRAFIPPQEENISVDAGPGDGRLIVNVLEANYYRDVQKYGPLVL